VHCPRGYGHDRDTRRGHSSREPAPRSHDLRGHARARHRRPRGRALPAAGRFRGREGVLRRAGACGHREPARTHGPRGCPHGHPPAPGRGPGRDARLPARERAGRRRQQDVARGACAADGRDEPRRPGRPLQGARPGRARGGAARSRQGRARGPAPARLLSRGHGRRDHDVGLRDAPAGADRAAGARRAAAAGLGRGDGLHRLRGRSDPQAARRAVLARHPRRAHPPERRRHHGTGPGGDPGRRRQGGGGGADRALRPAGAAGRGRGRPHGRHRHPGRRHGRGRGGGDRGHLQGLDRRRVRGLGARRLAVLALPRAHRLAGAARVRQHLLGRRHLVFRGHDRGQSRAPVLPAAPDRLGRQCRCAIGDADGARARDRRCPGLGLGGDARARASDRARARADDGARRVGHRARARRGRRDRGRGAVDGADRADGCADRGVAAVRADALQARSRDGVGAARHLDRRRGRGADLFRDRRALLPV
jgi:hypothetical protein